MRRQIDLLEEMTASEVAALLRARPDLTHPRPATLQELSGRSAQFSSVVRAIRGLTAFKLALVEALCVLDPDPPVAEVAVALGATTEQIRTALVPLRERLLAVENAGKVHLFPAVRQVVHTPLGLGPPVRHGLSYLPHHAVVQIARNLGTRLSPGSKDAISAEIEKRFADPAEIRDVIVSQPEAVRELIAALGVRESDYMATRPADRWDGGPVRTPAQIAQSFALLVPAGWDQLAVPREVGLCLRDGRLSNVRAEPPMVLVDDVDAAKADAAAGAAAQHLLAHVVTLIEECAERPVAILKSGGVGVRELRRLGKRLEVDEGQVARLVELTLVSGLLGISRKLEAIVPAPAADDWLRAPPAARWVQVAAAWVATGRYPSLAGAESIEGKTIPALVDHGAVSADQLRGEVLEVLGRVGTGNAAQPASVEAFLRWQFPRRFDGAPASFRQMVGWTFDEAALLGVTGMGQLSSAGRAVHERDRDAAERAAASMLPQPLTAFTVQADLTAIVPGALDPAAAGLLADMAEKESGGGATVWRFSDASVRRAFDRGHTAGGLHTFLGEHAAHGVPQTLTYLIDDIARRHGHVRVVGGATVVHGDDAALLAEAVRHRKLAKLGLRLVAPTVAVTSKKPADTIAALQAAGFLPVAESTAGTIALNAPAKHRADVSLAGRPARPLQPDVDADELAASLLSRAAEQPAPRPPPRPDAASGPEPDPELYDVIEDAMTLESAIVFGYRNPVGEATVVIAYPEYLNEFELEATTERGPQTYLLNRIEWLQLLDADR